MVQVENLCKTFRGRRALDGVSFEVGAGAKLAVLGANGAGKSTLLKILAGVIPPTSGNVSVNGAEIFCAPPESRTETGYMPEVTPLYPDMRVKEYLKFSGRLHKTDDAYLRRRLHDVLALCELAPQRDSLISRLSRGEQRRVAFAAAILHEPALLILDDPGAGLDEHQTSKIASVISSEDFSRVTVLFSAHSPVLAAAATQTLTLSAGKSVGA